MDVDGVEIPRNTSPDVKLIGFCFQPLKTMSLLSVSIDVHITKRCSFYAMIGTRDTNNKCRIGDGTLHRTNSISHKYYNHDNIKTNATIHLTFNNELLLFPDSIYHLGFFTDCRCLVPEFESRELLSLDGLNSVSCYGVNQVLKDIVCIEMNDDLSLRVRGDLEGIHQRVRGDDVYLKLKKYSLSWIPQVRLCVEM